MANDTNKTIIVRNQHRRGLKQDLPQPLRPGEIGFATDSRQVYIGGDSSNQYSADYNAVSYFENTLSAREHTISIANNQIIAFQVPFVKYQRGEFTGINGQKVWELTDARSTISALTKPACAYTSSDYPVFSTTVTEPVESTLASSTGGGSVITVNPTGGLDPTGNIRVGDIVTGPDFSGSVRVVGVERDNSTGEYVVSVNTSLSTTANANVTFTPTSIKSAFTNKAFTSTDVIVQKNGIVLTPDPTGTVAPRANVDYVIDGTETISTGVHRLSLRTAPSTTDTVTVSYYGKDAVLTALKGIQSPGQPARIAPYVNAPSFYDQYNIPTYRQIPDENIRLSPSTGLGYIGLQNKHIVSTADGGNIAAPTALTLGNLYISRNDIEYTTSNVVVNSTNIDQYDITFDDTRIVGSLEDIFSPQGFNSSAYSNSMVRIQSPITNRYLHRKAFHIISTADPSLTIQIPQEDFAVARSGTAEGTGNIVTIAVNTDGIQTNDLVRVVDDTGNIANTSLHDTIFLVEQVTSDSIRINVNNVFAGNTVPAWSGTTEQVAIVNHGQDAANINTTLQFYSEDHGLTNEISDVIITTDNSSGGTFTTNIDYEIETARTTANTFLMTGFTDGMPTATAFSGITGEFMPSLANSYAQLTVTPVLRIDLSANATLTQAVATVNKNNITIGTTPVIDNWTLMDFLPQDDGSLNSVYISQDPAYTSIDVGGLEFSLYEDEANPTLSVLNIEPGDYTRENSSVKSKLEKWFNDTLGNRDVNIFTAAFTGGTPYAANVDTQNLGRYDLVIDGTFGEIDFCSREEASNFNFVVNAAYSESVFDRTEDDQDGTRGLANLKNNLELQTREASAVGEKVLTYNSMEQASVLVTENPGAEIFSLDVAVYNNFIVEYSIREQNSTTNKYSRAGSMFITGRPDFADIGNAVVVTDTFSSTWENVAGDVIEPQFDGELIGNNVVLTMVGQNSNPSDPANGTIITHSIGTPLEIRYIVRRW